MVFDFPLEHRRSIRRLTRVAGVFPNEASCLRLISALLMEIREELQI